MGTKHKQSCSIAGFLNVFGDAWTLLIVREALFGTTRFSDFQRNTGAAKNLLSDRLSLLVDHGILAKVEIGTMGSRHAYHITERGKSLGSVLSSIILWANEHLYPDGEAPNVLIENKSGKEVRDIEPFLKDGKGVDWSDVSVVAGPGASNAARKRFGLRDEPK